MAAVGSLAAAVAHEINNPIAAISGIARSIAESGKCGGGTSEDFEGDGPRLILQQTERIAAISQQIAEFTRPHSVLPDLTDLNRLVRSVCKFTGYDARLRDVELSLDLDPSLPAVTCVADHVTQVLMNLLINAGDAVKSNTDRRPQIHVETRHDDGAFLVQVRDNGHGMDEGTRARAFDEGFTTKAADRGLGLGLFLCKALVEGDGGSIAIDSSPGTGTTVSIRLPISPGARA
jgi:signal transduction histidine kinase